MSKWISPHDWDLDPAAARRLQIELSARLELEDRLPDVRRVAGADVAFDTVRKVAVAGAVVFALPGMVEVERVTAERPSTFPYIPGLLAFREVPALLAAFERLTSEPDLIFCDAQGYAHPRRFGLASHLGLLLDRPTIGCAKSRLTGSHLEPGGAAGSWAALRDRGELIGAVVRTRSRVRPVFVSQGHRISLPSAIEWTLAVRDGYRVPRPTRIADQLVRAVRRGTRS